MAKYSTTLSYILKILPVLVVANKAGGERELEQALNLIGLLDELSPTWIMQGLYTGELNEAVNEYTKVNDGFEGALFDRATESHSTYSAPLGFHPGEDSASSATLIEEPLKNAAGPVSVLLFLPLQRVSNQP